MKIKQKLGEWLTDTSKYIVAGAVLGSVLRGEYLWSVGVAGLLLLVLGLFLQQGNKQKRFENAPRKQQPNREKRPSGENRKSERNKGKKRALEAEHKPNEITVE